MLDVYSYSHAHEFLRDAWKTKAEKNPAFSLRSWARQLGLQGHAPLHLMISGKRAIPQKYVPVFIESLGLEAKEGLFFETLVQLDRAKDPGKKEFYLRRLRELSPRPLGQFHEVEHFRYLRNPIHTILLEMTELKSFRNDPAWIASQLRFPVTVKEIEEAIDRLIGLGLLRESPAGTLAKTHHHLKSRSDITDKAVQEYHATISQLAAQLISSQPVAEREFNSFSMNIRKSSLPIAKTLIRDFIKQFIEVVEAPAGESEETYQLNVQFFSLTKEQ